MQADFEKKMMLFMQGHIEEDILRILKEDPRYNHQPLVKAIVSDKEDLASFQDKIVNNYVYGVIDVKNSYWVNIDRIIDKELGKIKSHRIEMIESVYTGKEYIEALPASHKVLLNKAVMEALDKSGKYEGYPLSFKRAVDEAMFGRLCDLENLIDWKETLAGGNWEKNEINLLTEREME